VEVCDLLYDLKNIAAHYEVNTVQGSEVQG
jgi:hypothetical protein